MKDVAPQHPVTLAFRDPALEREYLADNASKVWREYHIVVPAVALMWGSASWIDLASSAANSRVMLALRFGLTMPLLLGLAVFVYAAPPMRFERWWQELSTVMYGSILVGLVGMSALIPEPAHFNWYHGLLGFAVTLVGGFTLGSLRFVHAAIVGVLASVALAVVTLSRWPAPELMPTTCYWLFAALAVGGLAGYYLEQFRRRTFYFARLLGQERARSERLLVNVLPAAIAERLKHGERRIAERFPEVTVAFADIVGFTALSQRLSPEALLDTLDELFSAFDDIAERHGLEKIKTIGDAYMVVGGVPTARADHADAVAEMALAMRDFMTARGAALRLRIGIHTGPVVAGVIGKKKFSYDLWGDTVNIASRMESHGVEDAIQVTEATYERLKDRYALEPRGVVAVKSKGDMHTWLLKGRLGR